MKSTITKKIESTEPADIQAARAYQGDVESFNSQVLDTEALDDIKNAMLDHIANPSTFIAAARDARGAATADASNPAMQADVPALGDALQRIQNAASKYVSLARSQRTETFDGIEVSEPAIKSSLGRRAVQRQGEILAEQIGDYIEIRQRLITEADRRSTNEAKLMQQLRDEPVTKGLVKAIEWALRYDQRQAGTVLALQIIEGCSRSITHMLGMHNDFAELNLNLPKLTTNHHEIASMFRREFERNHPRRIEAVSA